MIGCYSTHSCSNNRRASSCCFALSYVRQFCTIDVNESYVRNLFLLVSIVFDPMQNISSWVCSLESLISTHHFFVTARYMLSRLWWMLSSSMCTRTLTSCPKASALSATSRICWPAQRGGLSLLVRTCCPLAAMRMQTYKSLSSTAAVCTCTCSKSSLRR